MVFIVTPDSNGECDCSIRTGDPSFVRIINTKNLICPEYRGNGVMASLGNILENQHIGMVFIDFYESTVGLHVNDKVRVISNKELLEIENIDEDLKNDIEVTDGRKPEQCILIKVEEAYIHCSKRYCHVNFAERK
jgi:predicted pyridoxine 5'-phosphate oxidase superfamily flavin-nucleotide-binding protein